MESGADSGQHNADEPGCGSGLVFWLLTLLALAVFTPCVLLPEWRDVEALWIAEQAQQHRLDVLQRRVDRERRVLEVIGSDPAAIARLAQRELSFQRPGETAMPVSVAGPPPRSPQPFVPESAFGGPPILARALATLPDYNYDAIFRNDETRPVILTLSITLIGVAFVLFGRRSEGRALRPSDSS